MIGVLRRPEVSGSKILDALDHVGSSYGIFSSLTMEDGKFGILNFEIDGTGLTRCKLDCWSSNILGLRVRHGERI